MAASVVAHVSSPPRSLASAPRSSITCHVSSIRAVHRSLPHFNGLRAAAVPTRVSSFKVPHSRTSKRGSAVVCEASDTAVQLPEVGKATWQELVLESDVPVLVDFWAPWCGPCRMIEPCIVKLAKTYDGKLKCYKLNTDENPDLATQYGIRSIPTMMIFKNGEKKDTIIGAVPESTLVTSIDKFV